MNDEGSLGYSQRYYQEHKERLQEKKKQRYLADPEYRASIRASALKRKKRLAEEREANAEYSKEREKPIWFNIEAPGVDVTVRMFTSGQLAKKLGRKTQTMRVWEKKGILPGATYRSLSGDRLYTDFQVAGIIAAYDDAEHRYGTAAVSYRIASTNFVAAVRKLWDTYPLGIPKEE